MFSGAAKRKKKKNEEEQKKRQRGGFQKFLSGSCPTAVNLLVSAEPEAEPGPQPGPEPDPEPGPETRPEDTAENAVAPSTSAPSQNDKMMEEQQPARNLFGFIQNLYNFFSASTSRREILTAHLTKCGRGLTLKSLSGTRWSARADATKALRFGYKAFQDALNEIQVNNGTPRAAQYEVSQLITVMDTLETAVMTVLWDDLLRRINYPAKHCSRYKLMYVLFLFCTVHS